MTTPTKAEILQVARQVAEDGIKNIIEDYTASVEKNIEYYATPPNLDDFYAWIEGYDWGQE